jgi:hypothetical protein
MKSFWDTVAASARQAMLLSRRDLDQSCRDTKQKRAVLAAAARKIRRGKPHFGLLARFAIVIFFAIAFPFTF